MSKKVKILFILGIILLLGLLFLGLIYTKKDKIYQLENKTYYEVSLNPNDYFVNDKLKADNYYIASSIKSIDIYFDYVLKNQTRDDINYSYDITATIKSYADNGTKLIWIKDFYLKNKNNLCDKDIKINENYKLDYQYYANYVKTFQEYYDIKTETYLYVKLNVKVNEKDNSFVLLTIPINEDIVEITMKEENTFLESNKQNIDLIKIVVFIIFIIFFVYLGNKILYNNGKEKTILKEYQDIIINIQNEPNIDINNVIYLTNLKDLINIAINNNVNIFNYQNSYYIIIDNIYYIFRKTI